jgi:hypothetical protein
MGFSLQLQLALGRFKLLIDAFEESAKQGGTITEEDKESKRFQLSLASQRVRLVAQSRTAIHPRRYVKF